MRKSAFLYIIKFLDISTRFRQKKKKKEKANIQENKKKKKKKGKNIKDWRGCWWVDKSPLSFSDKTRALLLVCFDRITANSGPKQP